ncbi:GAF sensor signal transduction histidine kinase [Lutibacter oricola]|uniref:histidine kinase n=1 Tax=Lutibacter oricola TaxID=762486 RepID=A0A1H2R3D8_9FLAO|nr:GAF domain-containing sensor histidine kinase [Lutibacter oricola]SDW13871.1 GAF sensor signal transduction histidine kinase [Lutibacter oricola]
MLSPKIPKNEKERINKLNSFSILDTISESDYDNLTAIASEICNTPISLISLIDKNRQWFKSNHGLNATETKREHAFCAHAINEPEEIFIVKDARIDERFHDNPLVLGNPNVVFYAGVPLTTSDGFSLGTLCVIDNKPKSLTKKQLKTLRALSNQVMNLLYLRKSKSELEKSLFILEEKNKTLEKFASITAHDLKSPLIGISSLTKLFTEKYATKIDKKGVSMLNVIENASNKLTRLIDGLLENSKSENFLKKKKTDLSLTVLIDGIKTIFSYEKNLKINIKSNLTKIHINRVVIEQILVNLISNAIKYSNKKVVELEIGIQENDLFYNFYIQDNGPGIEFKHHKQIFKIFEVVSLKDKFGVSGNGIGLATVKNLVEKSGGEIKVQSEIGKGAKFIFTISK